MVKKSAAFFAGHQARSPRQFSSVAQSCLTLCHPMDCSMPGFPVHHNSWSLPKLISIESMMPSNHLILGCPLLLLPSIFPSIKVFSNESPLCIRWPKYWSFSFSHQSFQWTPRTDLQNGLVGSPCSPRDSQESSSTPQFKSINSSALSFLYSPTLTSIHDYWKNHSLDKIRGQEIMFLGSMGGKTQIQMPSFPACL